MVERDADLAGRAKRGDSVALEALYRRYVDRVWRFAWLRTNDREAAAELVQETFLRAVRSAREGTGLAGFDGRSSPATWLFAICRSVAIDRMRREQRERRRDSDASVLRLIPPVEDSSDRAGTDDLRSEVRGAVARLPAGQRDATVLCELCGFSVREAAGVLGWSESRMKVSLFRGRRSLRELLKDYMNEDSPGCRSRRT